MGVRALKNFPAHRITVGPSSFRNPSRESRTAVVPDLMVSFSQFVGLGIMCELVDRPSTNRKQRRHVLPSRQGCRALRDRDDIKLGHRGAHRLSQSITIKSEFGTSGRVIDFCDWG